MIGSYYFNQVIAMIIIALSLLLMAIGVYGSFKYKNFYARILVSSKLDTVAFITMIIGVIIYSGFTIFSLKVLLLMALMLLINPLTTHLIARSAYKNGLDVRKK